MMPLPRPCEGCQLREGGGNALAAAKFRLTPQSSKLWLRCHIGPDIARPAQRVEDPPRPAEMRLTSHVTSATSSLPNHPLTRNFEIAAEEQMGGCHILRR